MWCCVKYAYKLLMVCTSTLAQSAKNMCLDAIFGWNMKILQICFG